MLQVVATTQKMRVSSNLWPQILVDFKSLFSIHPFFSAANFWENWKILKTFQFSQKISIQPHLTRIRWSKFSCSTTYFPLFYLASQAEGEGFIMQNSTQWYSDILSNDTNLGKNPQKNSNFCALGFSPQFTHPSILEGKRWKRVWRASKATRCSTEFLGQTWLRFADFDKPALLEKKNTSQSFLSVFLWMWQFCCTTIVCKKKLIYDIHGCTLLKALLHRLHGRGKAVSSFWVVYLLFERI